MRVGRYLYANRGKIRSAARSIRKFRKSRTKQKFSRRNIGEAPGTDNAKRAVTTDVAPAQYPTRTLTQYGLCDIKQGMDPDERIRRLVNVRGFKICCEYINLSNNPLYLNCAVVAPKAGAATVEMDDFFRAADGSERGRNFANDLTAMEFHCLPINTDRYTVLKHKRHRLVPNTNGSTYESHQGHNYLNLDWYIPLKRQLRYDSSLQSNPETGSVYFIWWADEFFTAAGSAAAANKIGATIRSQTYFRETWGFK